MPLILAIEPDRRQASQLTALVRGRLKADLVLGESADRALAALGERVPDLVLTAALLSPKDEAALGQRLRELNGVAAHVQTLTIPMLASSRGRGDRSGGGLLSALRRDKPKTATLEGCDPAVFAEQCKEYLERAASERELDAGHAQETYDDQRFEPIDAAEPVAQDASGIDVTSFEESGLDTSTTTSERAPIYEPPGILTTTATTAPSVEPSFGEPMFVEPAVAEPAIVTPAVVETPHVETVLTGPAIADEPAVQPAARRRSRKAQPLADPLEMTDGPASLVAALAQFEVDEVVTREEPASAFAEAPSLDVARGGPERVDAPVAAMPVETAHEATDETDIDETAETGSVDMDLSALLDESAGGSRRDRRDDDNAAVEVYDIDDSYLQTTALTLEAAADEGAPDMVEETEQPQEWVDIIEALRRDAEQMPIRKSRGEAANTAPAPVKASEPVADAPVKPKRQRPGAPPAQDEWGFFDPDQCGFAALLEKLQEITEDDQRPRRPPSA